MRVLIAEPDRFSPEAIAVLREVAEVITVQTAQTEIRAALAGFDVVWIRLGLRIGADDLPTNLRCGAIVSATTGLDHLDVTTLQARGVEIIALKGRREFLRQIRATAELTLALVLALLRRLPAALDSVQGGSWQRDDFRGREIFEKTVGIVGYGRLGEIVASYFLALGARVVAYDPHVSITGAGLRQTATLEELLESADIVSLHADLNNTSRGMLGPSEFARMKRGAVLINTARGELLDETALLQALTTGHLAGAALDVVRGEPHVDRTHPLVAYAATHENLLLTPHLGGATSESMPRCERFLAGILREWIVRRGPSPLISQP